jgi:hypothetical protein
MRQHLGVLIIGLLGACGKVEATPDAPTGGPDAPSGDIDAASTDAPPSPIDAPPTGIDAPAGPQPNFHWTMENSVNNSGTQSGFTLTTPAGVGYGAGKIGQAAVFGAGQYSYVDGVRSVLSTYGDMTVGFWFREPGNVNGTSFFDCNNRSTAPYGGVQMGLTQNSVSVCVSTSTSSYLSGGCNGFTAPSANTWHHWIMRYDGSGTGPGQGGVTQIYVDNVLVHTRPNDANNNPVWNPGIPDRLYLGLSNASLDDVRIYNQVFSLADQCTYVVRGTWTGSSCTLP